MTLFLQVENLNINKHRKISQYVQVTYADFPRNCEGQRRLCLVHPENQKVFKIFCHLVALHETLNIDENKN